MTHLLPGRSLISRQGKQRRLFEEREACKSRMRSPMSGSIFVVELRYDDSSRGWMEWDDLGCAAPGRLLLFVKLTGHGHR